MPDFAELQQSSEHPLKLLRTIVGISQQELAKVIGVGWDSVRAIEIGRRVLTPERLAQIQFSIGAIWDPHNRQWYFDPGGFSGRRIPYLREHYETFRRELRREMRERAVLVYYLSLRLSRFCVRIPDTEFNGWFWRMEQQFNKWRKEFSVSDEIELEIESLWDPKSARTIGYRKFSYDILKGEEKEFQQIIDAARKERKQTIEAIFPRKPEREVSKLSPKSTNSSNAQREQAAIAVEKEDQEAGAKKPKQKERRSRRLPAEESKNIS
jgi:transcriptional regulator with XRE-family HTH domain